MQLTKTYAELMDEDRLGEDCRDQVSRKLGADRYRLKYFNSPRGADFIFDHFIIAGASAQEARALEGHG
jgi:hypothetical protein